MKKNDQLSTFENLKKEAINSVKNFSSINDLPSISIEKSEIKNSKFFDEEVFYKKIRLLLYKFNFSRL